MGSSRSLLFAWIYLLLRLGLTHGARDILLTGETLEDGETLISAHGIFEFGFFSPGNSTKRYLGIWYKNITPPTIVWVANRGSRLEGKPRVFLSQNGLLKVSSEDYSDVALGYPRDSNATSTRLLLLDSGNLVLRGTTNGEDEQILGESFDQPSDTLLPGMTLDVSSASQQGLSLISWRSHDDPSPGEFSFGCGRDACSRLLVRQRELAYWGGPTQAVGSSDSRVSFYSPSSDTLYLLQLLPGDLSRFVLDSSGEIKQWIWSNEAREWELVWHAPTDRCNVSCGAFGVCDLQTQPICSCMKGFEPASIDEWKIGVWSKGCRLKMRSQCQNNSPINAERDAFLTMVNMRLPTDPQSFEVGSSTECHLACLYNCSCSAYLYDLKCYIWIGELFNLQQLPSSSNDTTYGEILNVRAVLPEPELMFLQGRKRPLPTIVLVVIPLATFLLGFVIGQSVRTIKIKHKESKELKRMARLLELGSNVGARNNIWFGDGLREGMNKDSELQLFSFASVVAATDNFWHANKLGEGGFGAVYKGKLHDGRKIAVKRLSRSSRQGLEEFKNEVTLIAKLQHMNLVRLLGCCIEKEEMMLLYEYMPNKSLDYYLFDATKKRILDWGKRRHIINGIAQGLLYLHQYSRLRVIHRDLKASNILLDGELNPKISDFGLARMFIGNEPHANTNRVVGTYGYMSPEYAMEGQFSIKSDVFSFGVLLLEIMSSKKNTELHFFDRPQNLLGYAWELWKRGWGAELIDTTLMSSSSEQEQMRYIHVGLLCVQEHALDRPTMSEVIYMLANDTGSIPIPNQPAFSFGRPTTRAEQPRNRPAMPSINEVTISALDGR